MSKVDESTADGHSFDSRAIESVQWMRDMAALVALPSLWVDQRPNEIVAGLLSVLFGVLPLTGAYAKFDGGSEGPPLKARRPAGEPLPTGISEILDGVTPGSGLVTQEITGTGDDPVRVACLSLPLPWETGVVIAWSTQPQFPTSTETHLLRVATSQAAIALHTARRLAAEHASRSAAEEALEHQRALLREVVDALGPVLEALHGRLGEATSALEALAVQTRNVPAQVTTAASASSSAEPAPALSGREAEVLGLLAQGLSNREIAGVLWVSDRTVERHITSLYRKIGVARRSEATAFALRHGLT